MQKDTELGGGDRGPKGPKFCPQAQIKEEACIIDNTSTANNKEGDIITWVWSLPLATAKLGGGAPVSYHPHTLTFIVFPSSILFYILIR